MPARILCLVAFSVFGLAQDPLTAEQAASLNSIREYAINYSQRLPDYTATQVVRREVRPSQNGRFTKGLQKRTDTVEEQIGYVDHRELHKVLRVNGRPPTENEAQQSGMYSRGEFGALLDTMFKPETRTVFEWQRIAKLGGRNMLVYAFRVPQLPNGYAIMEGSRTLIVPYKGLVFADAETKVVMRIQMQCTDIPSVSQYRSMSLTVDYKRTQVAGRDFILPSQFVMNLSGLDSDVTMQATYKDYRRFATDATIMFDSEP